MTINNLSIPVSIQKCIESGRWLAGGKGSSGRWTKPEQVELFETVFPPVEYPWPCLYDYDTIVESSDFTEETEESLTRFLGEKSEKYSPRDIDVHQCVIIGETEPDGFIALDYRTESPSETHFCNPSTLELHWIMATRTFEEFLERLDLV